MSSTRTMGVSVTDVSTSAQLPLGFEYHEPADATNAYGERVWVYIYNDNGSTAFTVGQVIYRDPSSADITDNNEEYWGGFPTPITVHQAKMMTLGVAQHAIAGGSYGFILKRGIGTVLATGAGVAADSPFTSGGDEIGAVIIYGDDTETLSSNIGVIGHTAAAITGDATGTAFISCGL